MTTEQYQIGYEAGYQVGFDEALAQQGPNPWQDAVIDQLVVHHIYQAAHDTAPRKAINDLLCISNDIALDPRVSSYAQALIDRGRKEAQQDQPDQQLCRFYGVGTYPELVAALEQHILRLQARLKTPLNPFHPINPRQGQL